MRPTLLHTNMLLVLHLVWDLVTAPTQTLTSLPSVTFIRYGSNHFEQLMNSLTLTKH